MGADVCAPTQLLKVEPRSAAKVAAWISHCGGLAIWQSQDLGQLGRRWFTPARLTDGTCPQRPHWSCGTQPENVITELARVEVVERWEAARIRVSSKPGYGLLFQLTGASTRRLDVALAAAGEDATYAFEGNVAVILGVAARMPLTQWLAEHPDAKAV